MNSNPTTSPIEVRQAPASSTEDPNKLYPVELSTDEDDMEGYSSSSCLPTVEEARSSMINPKDASILPKKQWSRRRCYIIGGFIVVVVAMALIIGLSVALTSNNNNNQDAAASASSSSERFDETVDYLAVRGISPAHTFRDVESPQYRAAQWIANEDAMRLEIPQQQNNNDDVFSYRFIFRYVMAVLFYHWGGISEWDDPLGFLGAQDVCQWRVSYTINPNTDFQSTFFKGVSCNEDGTPIMLDLESNQLVGKSIPDEIAHLTSLEGIDLRQNFIDGSLPNSICQLRNITFLQLPYNNFTETIPSCLADMPNLGSLIIHDNAFTGPLPSSFAQMTSLQYLYVNDNFLTGNPSNTMQALTSLSDLFVSHNFFTGTIDNTFLENHVNLTYLDMSHNNFTSTEFPSQLLQLPYLLILDLSENDIGGKLPEDIVDVYFLSYLSLYGNSISGSIPSSITNLIALQHLDLSLNQLTGDIPTQMGDLENLTKLYLSENPFTPGPFPSTLQNLTTLTELSMRNTNRRGSFPSTLSSEGMRILDLSSNQFTGMIPSSYGLFVDLSFLLLNNNSGVTGSLPTTFANLDSVHGFYLDGTNLTGNFDEFLCGLSPPTDKFGEVFERIIFADCGRSSPQVTCTCGCQCCDGDLLHGCSRPTLENLDLQFETNFDRTSYPDFKDSGNGRLV